jgi:uncharacterized protein
MSEDVETIRAEATAQFSSGEPVDGSPPNYADDVVAHIGSSGVLSGTYRGIQEFSTNVARMYEESNGTLKFDSPVVAGDGDLVFVLYHVSAERGNQTLSQRQISVMRMENGKAKETWLFSEDGTALDAFWS